MNCFLNTFPVTDNMHLFIIIHGKQKVESDDDGDDGNDGHNGNVHDNVDANNDRWVGPGKEARIERTGGGSEERREER